MPLFLQLLTPDAPKLCPLKFGKPINCSRLKSRPGLYLNYNIYPSFQPASPITKMLLHPPNRTQNGMSCNKTPARKKKKNFPKKNAMGLLIHKLLKRKFFEIHLARE